MGTSRVADLCQCDGDIEYGLAISYEMVQKMHCSGLVECSPMVEARLNIESSAKSRVISSWLGQDPLD